MWYNAVSARVLELPRWRAGDTVGCFLDIDRAVVMFSLNGVYLDPFRELFKNARYRVHHGKTSVLGLVKNRPDQDPKTLTNVFYFNISNLQ